MKRLLVKNWLKISITLFIAGIFFVRVVNAGTLSCSVATTCPSGTVIWRMSGTSNAHAELPSQSLYTQLVCCTGVTGLGTSCTGTFATALKLSGTTNAHAEQNSQANYANNACISVPSGGSVSVGYQATNCTGFDTTLGSMTGTTNAHVGDAYTTKICATAAGAAAQTLTFSLGANSVALGTLSASAVTSGSHTITVGTNAANGVAVAYSGSTLTSGGNTITAMSAAAASSFGTEQFGINAKDNVTPNVGLECSGTPPIAAAATGYSTVDNFKFVTGETIISSAGSINDTTCTISYIANISAATETGSYAATLTYIATATF